MRILSPAGAGDERISPSVLNVHRARPDAASTACTMPVTSPTYTTPADTAGDDSSIAPAALYDHFSRPVLKSIAWSRPSIDPTYTVPSAIAADDITPSLAWKVHRRVSGEGSVVPATPVSVGDPRNRGHSVPCATAVAIAAR